jgi:colicin import membrane protein
MAVSLAAHLLLVLALKYGVDWRSSSDAPAFEAELWAVVPQAAAPRAEAPPPEPEPAPTPKPQPPKPTEAQPDTQALREAEIKLERQRQADERQARERAERQEREQAKAKAEREKQAQDKAARERAERQERDKARLEREQSDAKREQLRQDQLRRMMGQAGATGGPQATGTAQQSSGPSANYAGRIKARVKPNITLLDAVSGNPLAEVEVRTSPDGTIISSRLVTRSGDPNWDAAVLRAVEKTERLPRNEEGRVPPVILLSFRPND